MISLLSVASPKKELPDHSNIKFETLTKYQEIAKSMIPDYIHRAYPLLARNILQNEDYLSYIATAIMMADWKWDGRGTKYGFRKECVHWTIRDIVKQYKKLPNVLSLNYIVDTGYDSHSEQALLQNVISDNKVSAPYAQLYTDENNLLVHKMVDCSGLTHKQKKYIKMRYFEEKTLSYIGKYYGVTKQNIQQSIKIAKKKMEQHCECS